MEIDKKEYGNYVKQVTPVHNTWKNLWRAFLVGGAGALVPITGFANSVVSPAIEYKAEGHVFGIGCKIFTIAGPVILYGIFASWVLGMVKFFWRF